MKMNGDNEGEIEVVFQYTSRMAVEDGILRFSSDYVRDFGQINLITTNLYNRLKETKTDINKIFQLAIKTMNRKDTFYAFEVVLKDGKKERLFIGLNDFTTKTKPYYTIMLDSDY